MSKLHIVLKINIDLFDNSGKYIERMSLPLPEDQDDPLGKKISEAVISELEFYAFTWIRRVFLTGFRVTACGFNHVDTKYHLWVKEKNGGQIRSKRLAKAIHCADPMKGGKNTWMKYDRTLLDDEELKILGLGKIELVPTVEKVLLVTEQTLNINKLPSYDGW